MKPVEKFKWFPQIHQLLSEYEPRTGIKSVFLKPVINEFIDTLKKDSPDHPLFQMNRDDFEQCFRSLLDDRLREFFNPSLRRVINATGVILHTGLGRAPFSSYALDRLSDVSRDFCNIEFNLKTGKRGERQDHVRPYLRLLTGAEDALVVNNNAAAVFLMLHSLAAGREVIVSRGELVEIGGSFRMPDVMSHSGALMHEIGTTNRTHLRDYRQAINENTGMILKVHPSNFRIDGFTSVVELTELVHLAREHNLLLAYDVGGGALHRMEDMGLPHEEIIRELIAIGVDIVTFSGDKLPGGPQSGIMVGRGSLIEKLHQNPLYRTVRVDKTIMALLEGTLLSHLFSDGHQNSVKTFQLTTKGIKELKKIGQKIIRGVNRKQLKIDLVDYPYQMGSGSLPATPLPSVALRFDGSLYPPEKIATQFRQLPLPIVGHIDGGHYFWNLRTIREEDIPYLRDALHTVIGGGAHD